MDRRRIERNSYRLAEQLRSAGGAAASEPQWPSGAPSPASLQAAGASIHSIETQITVAESNLRGLRAQLSMEVEAGIATMRQVDFITSALFGETSGEKILYGLKPVDRARNTPPAPKEATKLRLTDGPTPGSITIAWSSVHNARYMVEVWDGGPESDGSRIVSVKSVTTAKALFESLPIGLKLFVRVQVIAGKRSSPWSEVLSRYVNG